MVNERHARVYSSLERAGALTVRVAATAKVVSAEKTEDALRRLEDLRRNASSDLFKIINIKCGHAITVFCSMVQKLAKRNQSHIISLQ
jgi:hypothetical protein